MAQVIKINRNAYKNEDVTRFIYSCNCGGEEDICWTCYAYYKETFYKRRACMRRNHDGCSDCAAFARKKTAYNRKDRYIKKNKERLHIKVVIEGNLCITFNTDTHSAIEERLIMSHQDFEDIMGMIPFAPSHPDSSEDLGLADSKEAPPYRSREIASAGIPTALASADEIHDADPRITSSRRVTSAPASLDASPVLTPIRAPASICAPPRLSSYDHEAPFDSGDEPDDEDVDYWSSPYASEFDAYDSSTARLAEQFGDLYASFQQMSHTHSSLE